VKYITVWLDWIAIRFPSRQSAFKDFDAGKMQG
jgi:hypothetical protein